MVGYVEYIRHVEDTYQVFDFMLLGVTRRWIIIGVVLLWFDFI